MAFSAIDRAHARAPPSTRAPATLHLPSAPPAENNDFEGRAPSQLGHTPGEEAHGDIPQHVVGVMTRMVYEYAVTNHLG